MSLRFSISTPLMAATRLSTVGLYAFVNLNFPGLCGVFLKLKKFCRPCDTFGEKPTIFFCCDVDNPGSQSL